MCAAAVPHRVTSIGIMAQIINELESHPYKTHLPTEHPAFVALQCLEKHDKSLDKGFAALIRKSHSAKGRAKLAEALVRLGGDPVKALLGTTQAPDVIVGGVKANACKLWRGSPNTLLAYCN